MFCEFDHVARWNKSKSIIKGRSSFQISQLEILVTYWRSTNVNIYMSFQNSNFDGNFSTYVFLKSFWYYRELKIDCLTIVWKDMFTLTFVDLEYETSTSSWDIWNDDRSLIIVLVLFLHPTLLYSHKTFETEIHNEIGHINL